MSTTDEVQKLYVGYLGRAADEAGIVYWEQEIDNGVMTLEQLRANLTNEQPEYLSIYGSLDRTQMIERIYDNLFERAPDADGLAYWATGGGSTVNADQLIVAFMSGASAADQEVISNKVLVANYYSDFSDGFDITAARDIIGNVSGVGDTVINALKIGTYVDSSLNHAPVLTSNRVPAVQLADHEVMVASVADILQGSVFDQESAEANVGMALEEISSSKGAWAISHDGINFQALAAFDSEGPSLLLAATDWLSYTPDAGIQDQDTSFTYRAWDGSTGTAGEFVALDIVGHASAFSQHSNTDEIWFGTGSGS